MPRAVLHPHSGGGSEAEAPTNYPRLTRLGTTFVAAERSPRIAILVLTFRAMLDARRNKKSTAYAPGHAATSVVATCGPASGASSLQAGHGLHDDQIDVHRAPMLMVLYAHSPLSQRARLKTLGGFLADVL